MVEICALINCGWGSILLQETEFLLCAFGCYFVTMMNHNLLVAKLMKDWSCASQKANLAKSYNQSELDTIFGLVVSYTVPGEIGLQIVINVWITIPYCF